VSVFAE